MQLKALAIGLEAQDYESDKVEATDVEGYGQRTIEIDPHALQRFASARELTLETKEADGLHVNEYVLLRKTRGGAERIGFWNVKLMAKQSRRV